METNINKCLKLLKSGDIHLIDIASLNNDLKKKPSLGDIVQYELHNYCKKNMKNNCYLNQIIKLASLCYSKDSVLQFGSLDRFVGCVYYICSYLLKNEKYEEAISISQSLDFKKQALVLALKSNNDIINFLCTLHNSFISAAIELLLNEKVKPELCQKYSSRLALTSLKIFQYNISKNIAIAKSVLKKSKLYLHKILRLENEEFKIYDDNLKRVLNFMLPEFSCADYCLYYLFKVDHLLNIDYSNSVEMLEQFKRITQKFLILSKFSSCAKDILDSLLNLFFVSPGEKFLPDFNAFNNCAAFSDQNHRGDLLFLMISIIFAHGIQHWWKLCENEWKNEITSTLLKDLFAGILNLYKEFFKTEKLYCASSKSPYETCFADVLTGNLQKIQYTVRQCFKNKLSLSLSLIPSSRSAFNFSVQCVDVMKIMSCCEIQRSYAWKYTVIHHTNLIEDIIKQYSSEKTWTFISQCCQELLHQIVSSEFQQPFDSRRISILFQRWHQSLMKQQKFNDGLFVCAAFYASFPKEEADVIPMWLQTKSHCGNEILQEMTILEILKKYESAINEFNPKFSISQISVKSVLLMELKAYGSCTSETFKNSKTYLNLVSRIWKQLEKVDMDLWETAFAYACLVPANVSGDGKNLPSSFNRKCNEIISKLTKRTYKGKRQCRSFVYAGNLRLALFLHRVKMAENSDGLADTNELVLGYLKKAEEEKAKFGEDIDLNLTCNLIPASSHLTVDLETNYLNALTEIVEVWEEALRNGEDEMPTSEEFDFWLQNVHLVACLYELYGEYHRSLSTWFLFYKIGKLRNDSSAILLGLSKVLKNCLDTDKSGLMEEASKLAELESKSQSKETLVLYWLTVASDNLKNKRPEKCLENIKSAKKYLESLRMSVRIHALQAKLWCLISQFLTLYPDYEVEFGYREGTDLRVIVFKAFNYALAGARSHLLKSATQLECTELVLAMLEVNIWAFHFHEIYSQTDFMRFFLDDLYQIVQRLFLPTRTAEVLVRLAEVDVICEKSSDCQEKVTKLKSILSISGSETDDRCKYEKIKPCAALDSEKSSPRAISPARFLETPISSCQTDDVSPIQLHLSNRRKKTNSLQHGSKCKCRPCQNLLIQILVMITFNLEGEVEKLESRWARAAACYNHAHLVASKLKHLRAEKNEKLQREMADVFEILSESLDIQAQQVKFYMARFWLKYAIFESISSESITEKAKNCAKKVSQFMENSSYEKKLLMWKFAELKLFWVVLIKGEPQVVRKDSPKEYKTGGVMKTPFAGRLQVQKSSCKKNLPKETAKVSPGLPKPPEVSFEDENCSSDEINTGFLGLKIVPSEKKLLRVHPKQLIFGANEPLTLNKTAKKAPAARLKSYKPKKLNLDESD